MNRQKLNTVEHIENKNRDVIKATVYGGGEVIKKAEVQSNQITQGEFFELQKAGTIIAPPLDLLTLLMQEENSSELRQCIDAMETNIEGFGGRLQLKQMSDDVKEKNRKEIDKEYRQLRAFLLNINPRDNLTKLRKKARRDLELCGNGYWELIPPLGNRKTISAISYVAAHTIRIAKQDEDPTPMTRVVYDPITQEKIEQTFHIRFRRFVQVRNNKKIYFKEYGDPRIIDKRDGRAYKDEAEASKEGVKRENYAHPIYHFLIHSPRSPYGLPRYIGNLFSVFGSRAAEEINYNTFLNNNIPSLAILVSGNAMLTEGTVARINEFAQSIMKRSNNYSKFLILEAEPATEGIQNSGTAKIEIEKLKGEQHQDQLFQNYDANNADKIRRAFRLPPIFVGKGQDANRATAEVQRKLAEEQIFEPERKEMDGIITQLFSDMGYKFWEYKSFSQNVTNDEDLVNILSKIEKTGALTPNFARKIVADVMNTEPEFYGEDAPFDPDVPFSLTMAEAVKAESNLGGNPSTGALAPNQGQIAAEKMIDRLKNTPDILQDVHAYVEQKLKVHFADEEDSNENEQA